MQDAVNTPVAQALIQIEAHCLRELAVLCLAPLGFGAYSSEQYAEQLERSIRFDSDKIIALDVAQARLMRAG